MHRLDLSEKFKMWWYNPTSILCLWLFGAGWLVGWAFLPINYCSFLSLQSCREKKRIMAQFWAFNGRCPLFAFLTAGRKDLEIAAFHRRSNSKLNISWLDASLLLVQHSRCTAQKNITFLSSHQARNWWGHLVMIPYKEMKMVTFVTILLVITLMVWDESQHELVDRWRKGEKLHYFSSLWPTYGRIVYNITCKEMHWLVERAWWR